MREGRKTGSARALRRRMTEAEQRLWYWLRGRRLLGCKFRRQHPVGPYIVDFACLEYGLVIELDGSQHLDAAADHVRDAFLKREGFTVMRFWNNEALSDTDKVCDAVAQWLAARPRVPVRPLRSGTQ